MGAWASTCDVGEDEGGRWDGGEAAGLEPSETFPPVCVVLVVGGRGEEALAGEDLGEREWICVGRGGALAAVAYGQGGAGHVGKGDGAAVGVGLEANVGLQGF